MEFVTRDPGKVGAAWRFVTFAIHSAQGSLVTAEPEDR